MENAENVLKLADAKKQNLQRLFDQLNAQASTALLFTLQWKDLERDMESVKDCLMKQAQALVLREKRVMEMKEIVDRRGQELENNLKNAAECLKEIPDMEEQLRSIKSKFSSKEEELTLIQLEIEDCNWKLQLKTEEVGKRENDLQKLRNLIGESNNDLELRKRKFKMLDTFCDEIDSKKKEPDGIEKSLQESKEQLGLKQRKHNEIEKLIDLKQKHLDSIRVLIQESTTELEAKEKLINQHSRELDMKLSEFMLVDKSLKARSEDVEKKERELNAITKSIEDQSVLFRSKEKELASLASLQVSIEECKKELETLNEQGSSIQFPRVSTSAPTSQSAGNLPGKDDDPFHVENGQSPFVGLPMARENVSLSADSLPKGKHFSIKMGGVDLILFLDDHDDEDCDIIVCDEAADSFQAKLVLHSIKDPYPSNLRENKDLMLSVSIEDCCLLVALFRRISPQIKHELKEEATKFAHSWKPKLVKKRRDPLEVISFLHFLAAYGLASSFDAVELIRLLDTDNWQKKAPDLCEVLGFADMIPNFIDDLIKRERRIEAIKYIHALNVVDKFPPATLLNDHLSYCARRAATKSSNERQNSIEAQIEFITAEVKALKDVVKCIVDYNIRFGLSTEMLEQRIMQQEKEREKKVLILENLKTCVARSHSNLLDQQREQQRIRPMHSTPLSPAINLMNVPTSSSRVVHSSVMVTPSSQTFAPTLSAIPPTQVQQQNRINHPRRTVSPYRTPVFTTSDDHLVGFPLQQLPVRPTNHPHVNTLTQHHNLTRDSSTTPLNMQPSIHNNQDTLDNDGYGGQVPFRRS